MGYRIKNPQVGSNVRGICPLWNSNDDWPILFLIKHVVICKSV